MVIIHNGGRSREGQAKQHACRLAILPTVNNKPRCCLCIGYSSQFYSAFDKTGITVSVVEGPAAGVDEQPDDGLLLVEVVVADQPVPVLEQTEELLDRRVGDVGLLVDPEGEWGWWRSLLEQFVAVLAQVVDPAFLEGPDAVVLDELDDVFGERADLVLPPLVVEYGEEGEEQVGPEGERHPPLPDHAGEHHVDILDLDDLAQVLLDQQQVLLPPRPLQHPHHHLRPLVLRLELEDLVLLGGFGQDVNAHVLGERLADARCELGAEVGREDVEVALGVLEVELVLQEGRQDDQRAIVLLDCLLQSDQVEDYLSKSAMFRSCSSLAGWVQRKKSMASLCRRRMGSCSFLVRSIYHGNALATSCPQAEVILKLIMPSTSETDSSSMDWLIVTKIQQSQID